MWERMVCWFVCEIDLPLGTDIDIVGVAWVVRDVLPPTQHGYQECWRGWLVCEIDLPLGMDISNVGVAWSVCDVLPPTQHGYRQCGRGWFVGFVCEIDLPLRTNIDNMDTNSPGRYVQA